MFLLSSLVTGPRFISISSLVLESWQLIFIRDWPEIWKSEISSSEFSPISGDWGNFGILDLARMSLIKCYCMLQNLRVTAFTVSELLRENKQGGKITPPPIQLTQIRVKSFILSRKQPFFLFLNNRACEVTYNLWDIPPIYLCPFEKYRLCVFIN